MGTLVPRWAFALWLASGCTAPSASSLPAASKLPGSGAPVCSPIRATGEAPLIDDFEQMPGRTLGNEGRGGWWFSYDDGTAGKLVREEIDVRLPEGEGRALHLTASGYLKWGAGFGATLHPETTRDHACPYDASVYSGVRFRARGRGRLRMTLMDAKSTPAAQGGSCTRPRERCYDGPGVSVDLEDPYETYEYPFCALLPQGWGGSSDALDPARLVSVQFRVGEREDVEVWLDDLSFYEAPAGAPLHCGPPCPLDAVPHSARIEPLASTAPLGAELTVHTFEQATKSCGAITRRYLSYVPGFLGPRSSAPVLMMLHGSSANAESARSFLAHDRFDFLARRDGLLVVYPNAAPGAYTSPDPRLPNTGVWRHGFFDDGQVDDIEYLERVLADLVARGVITGDNPVFLTALSNGGGMVLEAARRIPQRLRGVAALMPYDGEEPKPAPDLSRAGLKRILFAYGIDDPGMAPGYDRILAPVPAQWAAALGIPAAVIRAPQKTVLPDVIVEGQGYRGSNAVALATRDSHVTELDMVAPDGRLQVRVLILDHAGHFWPNPTPDTEDWVLEHWGLRNQDFDAADMVWDFLRGAVD